MLVPMKISSLVSVDLTSSTSLVVAALQIILTSTAYFNEKTNQTPVLSSLSSLSSLS